MVEMHEYTFVTYPFQSRIYEMSRLGSLFSLLDTRGYDKHKHGRIYAGMEGKINRQRDESTDNEQGH